MAAPGRVDSGDNSQLELVVLVARVRVKVGLEIWRRRERYFRDRSGWVELVFGGRRVRRREDWSE